MTLQLTTNPRRQHETREAAERAIEIYYPAGNLYEVVGVRYAVVALTFAVKAWNGEGNHFLGYCWDPAEEAEAGT
jgi:hypothetical protein